ncbi:MAG: hypothetical protein EHM12_10890 [Dehalococcoidia bacterium]|nr:MAG: hypothetical protein EHM12_10890 [Dehalococcoidia bacterium]
MAEVEVAAATVGVSWPMVIIVIAFVVLAIAFLWYDVKKAKTRQDKPGIDIFGRAIVVAVMAVALLWLGGQVGVVDPEWLQHNKWLYVVVLVTVLALFFYVFKNMMPLEIDEMYDKYVLPKIDNIYHARPYIGSAAFDPLIWAKRVTRIDKTSRTERIVDSFLVRVKSAREIFMVLMQYDPVRKTMIFINKNPPDTLIYSLLGQEAKESYNEFMRVIHGEDESEQDRPATQQQANN